MMGRICLVAALAAVLSCLGVVAADVPAPSWPCWRGGDGSGSLSSGLTLVDNLKDMKLVWESEEQGLSSSYAHIMGGAAGPVVADGKVFVNYCMPGGDAVAEGYYAQLLGGKTPEDVVKGLAAKYSMHISTPEDIRRRCLIGADDIILCADAVTGKTLWKAVFKDAGMNPSMQVRGWPFNKMGPHCVAVAAFGKVLGIGSMGLVHCVDAKDGTPLWEYKTASYTANLAAKQKIVAGKGMAKWNDPRVSPTFADGVFIVPDGGKIVALDPEKGTKLWEAPANMGGPCAPIRWVYEGKEYIIARDKCIEPKTGKVLWAIPGAAHGSGTVAVGGNYLLFTGVAGSTRGGAGAGFSAYKITPEKAEKAWQTDAKYVGGGSCSPVIMDGYAYGKVPSGTSSAFACIEMATGNVVATQGAHSDSCGSMIGADGHLYYNGFWAKADPKDFKVVNFGLIGKDIPAKMQMGDDYSYALAASSTPCIVDGKLYVRGQVSLLCFDLRKDAK